MNERVKVKLGDIVDSCLGKMLHAEKNCGDYQPYLANVNVRWGNFDLSNLSLMKFEPSEAERYGIKNGDLIICEGGEPGRCAIWREQMPNMKIQKALHRVRAKNGLDIRYLYYWLLLAGKTGRLERYFTGSTIKHLPGDSLSEIEIELPPINNQKAVSTILDSIDRKISLNNAINAELEKTAKLLYNYWFVQFDFPNTEGKPYRASGGKMIYNEQLKRKIPKGWKAQKLNKTGLCTMMSSGINAFDGEKIYLSTSEVDGIEIVNHSVTTDYANRLQRANMQPHFNSVWFAKMKDTVKNILVNEGAEILASDYILSTGFAGLQCTPTSLYYVWNYLRGDYFETKKNLVATGATQQAINNNDLNSFDILVPSSSLIEQFHKTVAPYYHMISKSKFENKELVALRDFLLPLLMNGQVTVAAGEVTATEVKPSAVSVPAAGDAKAHRSAVFKRLVLSAYILDNICDEPTAGRVKFEKLLFLSEHCAQLPLHSEFHRSAAGPYDRRSLYAIESQLQKNRWFQRQKITGESRAYSRLPKVDAYKTYIDTNLNEQQKSVIDKLIRLFKTASTIQCEIVATLYGAWNDFIIDGKNPTDDQIVDEVLTNWHKSKERIDRKRWLTALGWMRQNDIVPVGYGASTKNGKKEEGV